MRHEVKRGGFVKAFYFVIASVAFAFIGAVAALAQRVEVLSAYYGVGNYRIEVTEQVQRLASNGEAFEVSSRNLGLPSVPIPGKQLTVVYSVGGRKFRQSAQEGETFRFRTAGVSEQGSDRDESRGLRVVRAVYGSAGSSTDVTDQVRRYLQSGESFRVSPEAFGMDPDQRGGHLRITVIDRRGERVQRVYEDGDHVDFR
jgi:hypothetical protein